MKSEKIDSETTLVKKNENTTKIKVLNTKELQFQSIRGHKFDLKNWNYRIVLVLNYPGVECRQCFKELNQIMKKLNEDLTNPVKCALIFPYYEEERMQLLAYSRMIRDLLKQDSTFYDIKLENTTPENQRSNYYLFDKYKIDRSPAVILINEDKSKYLSNTELYDINNYEKNYKIFEEFFK